MVVLAGRPFGFSLPRELDGVDGTWDTRRVVARAAFERTIGAEPRSFARFGVAVDDSHAAVFWRFFARERLDDPPAPTTRRMIRRTGTRR
jgi:hypothetical protein